MSLKKNAWLREKAETLGSSETTQVADTAPMWVQNPCSPISGSPICGNETECLRMVLDQQCGFSAASNGDETRPVSAYKANKANLLGGHPGCSYTKPFSGVWELKRHTRVKHNNDEPFVCPAVGCFKKQRRTAFPRKDNCLRTFALCTTTIRTSNV